MTSARSSCASDWRQRIGRRLRTVPITKASGTTLGIGAFFVAYFWTLHHPLFAVITMPLTAPDRWIGFVPQALPLYASLWLYVSLAPALLADRRELLSFGLGALVLSLVGLGIFMLWPTAVPALEIDWSRHAAFVFLKQVDMAGNACPSLHAAFAVFAALWIDRVLRDVNAPRALRGLDWLWCAGILYSTLAVRQHVALDVLAGALLGAVVGGANLRWRGVPVPAAARGATLA
ncbi:phosphatase PAP2 family protein [Methylibium sp.]|uniref:phosphatase PAP2 family protein n=1 Tax=Methylibium sp. TaxID=2067992 RepID=UPI00286C3B89|nr:phosphatase PAP2 family protein [Methylibium sp.]